MRHGVPLRDRAAVCLRVGGLGKGEKCERGAGWQAGSEQRTKNYVRSGKHQQAARI